jgi:hypothetical protein
MTDAWDHPDAPPLDDPPEFNPGFATPNDYVLKLANAIDRLASVLDKLSVSPGGAPAAVQAQPPGPPTGPPAAPPGGSSNGGSKTLQQKRGGLIFYACRDHGFPGKAAEVGQQVTGRPMNADSRLWADADQVAVLDAMKAWGWVSPS